MEPDLLHNRGQRVVDLRRLLTLTQKQLSTESGIAQSNLSDIERGNTALTQSAIHRICTATRTPTTYFDFSTPNYSTDAVNFRKNSRVSAKGRDFVMQAFKEIERISETLTYAPVRLRRVNAPLAEQADIASSDDIELHALDVREAYGLEPDSPIRNVTRMLERAGVAVAPMSVPADNESLLDGHCGMSRWDNNSTRASVAFIAGLTGDRQRFTLAHEFGHVLLHTRRRVELLEDREREADHFAGALLLPKSVAEKSLSETLTLHGYMRIKAKYGISIQAIITRGQRLGLLSRERQRSLMIQISSRGWRTREPVDVGHESPALLWTELTARHGPNPYFAASTELGVSSHLLQQWIPQRKSASRDDRGISNVVRLKHR